MPYPGGPHLEKKALKGNAHEYKLPHPLLKNKDLNFSFSGIKTAISLLVKKNTIDESFVTSMSASFQKSVVDILKNKIKLTIKFLLEKNIKINQISLVGGVAANKYILDEMRKISHEFNFSIVLPPKFMLSDNAAMIAWACLQKKPIKKFENINFKANPKLKINEILK